MSKPLRIVLAQLNLHVGDIQKNLKKHIQAAITARDELQADVIVFPELSLTGYPPEDLLLRNTFIEEAQAALDTFTASIKDIYCLVGHPYADHNNTEHHHRLYNACSLVHNGKIIGRYEKQHLPNYGVFDEARYFTPGTASCVLTIKGISVGVVICEDLWKLGPTHEAALQGAQIILSPNASPFEIDKHEQRLSILTKRATHDRLPILYTNYVGGQDALIFDGGSMAVNEEGQLCQFAGFFNEQLLPVDLNIAAKPHIQPAQISLPSDLERIYQALVLSMRDYIEKNHFPSVILGLSGGIDSALTLAIAVDAIGKDRVHAVLMPSRYTTNLSIEDAILTAKNAGVECDTISIESSFQSLLDTLAPSFMGKKSDITEENMQARCRAIILMALSNKFGHLVLSTGNRSELAVGYCTLYGDMAGGFAVLKDVPKTLVYQLANFRNSISAIIPQSTIDRPPTAELAHDQKDEDSLPPYDILDKILDCYINHSQSIDEITSQGIDRDIVTRIIGMIRRNEYKRSQAAIGPHINHKTFGIDWRYPLTNGYKG